MEYQFDYATFCKTFNVKDDKAIDSLRLTHTQDINFKLFPYKARGIFLDNTSKEYLQDFFTKLNLIDKKSDSGDAQYVKRIL